MDNNLIKSPKVIIPIKRRIEKDPLFIKRRKKIEEDPLNKGINIGIPTPFISSFSLLKKAKNILKEAIKKEKEEKKINNISKLINSLDLIINNKEEDKEEERKKENKKKEEGEKKEEKKEGKNNIPLEKEILDLKDKINKVSIKLDSFNPILINSNNKKEATWAEVAKKNKEKENINNTTINSPNKANNKSNIKNSYKNQRLVLITKDKNQEINSYNLRKKVNKELNEKKGTNNNNIISIIKNRNNNIIITTKEGVSPNILLENQDILKNNFNFIKAIRDRDYFNLIIHDIPNNIYKGPLVLNQIKKELEEDNIGLSILGNPSYLSKKENRTSKATSSIIISLNTEEEREKYLKKKIFLGGSSPRIEKYLNSSPLDQCSRC